jgi:hypothetical protein
LAAKGRTFALKGNLGEIGIADMIKALSLIGKSGKLSLISEGSTGHMYLRQGNLIAAEAGKLRGEDALYAMALWTTGSFSYDPVTTTFVDPNIHVGSESLFIGLSSRVDRYNYLLSRCPALDAYLTVDSAHDPDHYTADQHTPEQRKLLEIISKRPIFQDALSKAPYDKLKFLELMVQLYADKVIGIVKKASKPVQEGEPRPSLETNLKVVSIGEVAQILVLIKRDGKLTAEWDDREGEVYIQHGNITYAKVEALESEGAVYRLLTWKDGYCKFFAGIAPEKQNVQKNIESIFFEGMDILAEFNKFMEEFPSLNAYVDVISVTGQENISPKESKILKLVNEKGVLNEVIKYSPYSDLETLKLVAKLYAQRMIGLSKGVRGQKKVDYDKEADDLLKDLL